MASDEQFSLCWNNFHANMSAGFHGLLSRGDLVDVTLAAEGRLLQAHKLVLSVCSPYFQEMFKMNPTQHPIVFLKDVSHSALRDLLQFMYQGEVNVKQEELASFISTAEQLQVKGLTGNQNEDSSTPSKPKPTSRPGPRSSQQRQSVMTKLETDLDSKPSSTPVAVKRPNRPSIASNNSSSSQSGPAKRKCVDPLEAGPSGSAKEEFVTIPDEDENNAVAPKMEPEFVNESMWDDDEDGANNEETNFGEDDSNMEMTGFDGSTAGDGNITGGGEGGAVGDAQVPRGSMAKDGKLMQYRNLAPRNSRANKNRKPRKHVSEDEESDESTVEEQPQEEQNNAAPMAEEPTAKLPEDVVRKMHKFTPGILMISGLVSWDLVARRDNNPTKRTHPNLYTFHKFTDRKYRFIASSCSAGHSVLVDENGEVYTFGRNTFGQLGFGDTVTRNVPEPVPSLKGKNIIHAAVGRNHTLFVTDTGTVYACGENKCGQCGLGFTSPHILTPTRVRYSGAPIIKVGCGAEFSMILDYLGSLYSFGLPEYGQLGHNTDGKYFVTSTKLSFHFETAPKHVAHFFEKTKDGHVFAVKDVDIIDFSCGNNHTVAIDSKKRAFSWGFGGFGRLGHAEQKDESVPRLIKYFESQSRGVRSVHCGGTYSLAVNEIGSLFMFGQTKRTGEANMYPKPVQDLSGWNIRSIGTSNTSIVIAADESLVAWGVSPTYGELGTGDINKSSARPKEVSRMEGLSITQVTMGYSHTLLLCSDEGEEVKAKLASVPTFNP